MPPTTDDRLKTRLTRARHLAGVRPDARAPLEFFVALTEFQRDLVTRHNDAPAALGDYLEWLKRRAPAPIARAADEGLSATWAQLQDSYANGPADAPSAFVAEALYHAFPPDPCPYCSAPPVVSLLREAGHGARRSHVCGVCLSERPAVRLGCIACGETDFEKLAVFRSETTDPARVDACESCRGYMKTIDLTRDAGACPVADDLASVTLDLWARDHGYHRVRPNLLRL
jgi:FdhE protein